MTDTDVLTRSDGNNGYGYLQQLFEARPAMLLRITGLPQPRLAEVRGIATAAGCGLVAGCTPEASMPDLFAI